VGQERLKEKPPDGAVDPAAPATDQRLPVELRATCPMRGFARMSVTIPNSGCCMYRRILKLRVVEDVTKLDTEIEGKNFFNFGSSAEPKIRVVNPGRGKKRRFAVPKFRGWCESKCSG